MTILERHPQAPVQARSGANLNCSRQAPGRECVVDEGVKRTFKKRMVVRGASVDSKRRESAGMLGPNAAGREAPGN